MQITFDTTTLTKDEALGLFALLDTLQPGAFDPGPELTIETERAIEDRITTKVVNLPYTVTEGDVGVPLPPAAPVQDQTTPTPPNAPERDSRGLPWHEAIHAGSKALNADGTWRTKRGVDKALVEQIEGELRQAGIAEVDEVHETVAEVTGQTDAVAIVAPPAPPPAPPAPEAPTAPLAPTPTPAPIVDTNSTPVVAAESSVSTPVAATGSAISPFVALMKRVTTAQGAGKLTPARVKELLESIDKKGIMDLRTDDDALASFAVLLGGEGV